jgi:catechol 2,3-dioxygenase-like lactoylglutathione lyase family enzyme
MIRAEMLTGHATVLLVQSVKQTTDYYRDQLGFEVELYDTEPALYGSARRDGCHVHFAHYDGVPPRPNHEVVPPDMFDAYFWPDDVDALHAELKDRGATIIQAPTDQPYGLREFRVQDPDGHILAFGRRIADTAGLA